MNYLGFNQLLYKLIDDSCLDNNGKIKEEIKYKINIPEFKVQNSKFIGKPGDKFETMLFLPPNEKRIAEGGLRTRGLFRFSYKLLEDTWYICDFDGNPVISAPKELQDKINNYVNKIKNENSEFNISELPLISVITVVYNGVNTLEDTIKSVINQTYPNVEYIIIDGGSTDGTLDIIKKYENYIDYWVSEPDEGIYDAMNKGIMEAFGNFYVFIGADDKIIKNWLEVGIYNIYNLFQFKDIIYIYGNINFLTNNRKIPFKYAPLKNKLSLRKDFTIPHSGSIISSKLFRLYSLYDKNYKICGDYAWILKVVDKIYPVYLDFYQVEMRLGGASNSSKNIRKLLEETKMIEKHFNIKISKVFKLKKIVGNFWAKIGLFEQVQSLYWQIKHLIKIK